MSNCLIGSGPKTKDGYIQIWHKTHDGYFRLHRYVYAKHHGVILTSKDVVRHLCNNPSCIEISHLICGTIKDNCSDSLEAGTFNRQKLLPGEVADIRRKYEEENLTMKELGAEYGVSAQNISLIVSGKRWS